MTDKFCVVCGKMFQPYGRKKTCSNECSIAHTQWYNSQSAVKDRKREAAERHEEIIRKRKNDEKARKKARSITKAVREAKKAGKSYGQMEAEKYMKVDESELKRREELKKRIAESRPIEEKFCRCVKCHKQIDVDSKFCKFCGGFQRREEG